MEPTNIDNRILWVCRENKGRSQVAEALSERARPDVPTASAGIRVDYPGRKLEDCPEAEILIGVMDQEYGIDMRPRTLTALNSYTGEQLGRAALVVVLAEIEVIPPDLFDLPNLHHWQVPDLKDLNVHDTTALVRQIEAGVTGLLRNTV